MKKYNSIIYSIANGNDKALQNARTRYIHQPQGTPKRGWEGLRRSGESFTA